MRLQDEVVAALALVFIHAPTQFLDGTAEIPQIRYVTGFQIVPKFFLDSRRRPEVLLAVIGGRLEELRQNGLGCRLLLIQAVVPLKLALVVAGEPVDAVRLAQFGDGLGVHLLVG